MNDIFEDIARTPQFFSTELDMYSPSYAVNRDQPDYETAGPNNWAEVTEADFGRYYDFEVIALPDGRNVFLADSNAAYEWACRYFPEHCDRYAVKGFIASQCIDQLVQAAERDKLVDRQQAEQEYVG